jgi:hypothetical protein
MKIVRTIVWVLLLIAFVAFTVANWEEGVDVQIWANLVVGTKLPAVVVIAFLIGLVPTWLLHRATKWQLHRRIASLENAAHASAMAAAPSPQPASGAEPLPEEPRTDLTPADETKPTP